MKAKRRITMLTMAFRLGRTTARGKADPAMAAPELSNGNNSLGETPGIVVDGRHGENFLGDVQGQAKGRSLGRIEGNSANELSHGGELVQAAPTVGIALDRITVGNQQVNVGSRRQSE